MSGRLLATSPGSRPQAFGPAEWALLLGTAAIWGTSYLWIEIALRSLAPGVVALGRVTLGLAAISMFPAARAPIAASDRARLVALGIGWFGLPMVTFPIAQDLGVASSVVGMLNGAMPLLTMFFASLLLRRMPGARQVVGVLIGLVGLVAVSWPQFRGRGATAVGVAIILLTMASNALFANVLVPMQQRYGSLPVLQRTLSVAAVFALPFALVGLPSSHLTWGSSLAMVPLGLLSTGLAFIAWTTLIGRTGTTRGSVVSYLVPVIAIGAGVLVLGENVEPLALAGTVIVLVGAWLVSGRDRQGLIVGGPDLHGGPPVRPASGSPGG